ncbi:hypothetical protein E1263_28335 [Kribbella antibiotica]|uniref:Uncharacterized protein n=1 Tax=Kribbella antibiotica TaxID=190195 RepID=A0A4R4Z544_9ACTN|nr:hypothetical protein [Kribbella antibiotica]TDD53205.1 hypothetical protein E1263_28335 [Kribbella antibiotica]
MTRELKALMDQETDRSDNYFSPDPAVILAAGRRRQRVRNLGLGATLMTVLVLLAGGLVLVLPNQEAQVAGLPGRSQDAYKQCDTSSGRRLGKDSWSWPEIVTLTDQYGSASLRRNPGEPSQVAFCVTQPKAPSLKLPLGQHSGLVVRKTELSSGSSVVSVFGRVYDKGATVLVSVSNDGGLSTNPLHLQTLPPGTGKATIATTYWVYRYANSAITPGLRPTVQSMIVRANGSVAGFGQW